MRGNFSYFNYCFQGAPALKKWDGKRDRFDDQKLYLTVFASFLLKNENGPEDTSVCRGAALDHISMQLSKPKNVGQPPRPSALNNITCASSETKFISDIRIAVSSVKQRLGKGLTGDP